MTAVSSSPILSGVSAILPVSDRLPGDPDPHPLTTVPPPHEMPPAADSRPPRASTRPAWPPLAERPLSVAAALHRLRHVKYAGINLASMLAVGTGRPGTHQRRQGRYCSRCRQGSLRSHRLTPA